MLKQKNLIHNSTILASNDVQVFLLSYQFSSFFQQLLYKKNILTTDFSLIVNSSNLIFNFTVFFRKKRLLSLRKQKLKKNKIISSINIELLNFLLKNIKKDFNCNQILVKFSLLNKLLIVPFFFKFLKKKLKYFKKTLFERHIFLYYDFLKITVLFQLGHVNIDCFLLMFAEIFERLHKGKHAKFFKFIRVFFTLLIKRYKYYSFYRKIIGVKFKISGKLKGKLRANSVAFKFGSIPINTFDKNIESSKIDVFTIYGTYGFKLWVYQSSNALQNLLSIEIVKRLKFYKYKKYFFFKKKLFRKNNKYWLFKLKCQKFLKRRKKALFFFQKIKKARHTFLKKINFSKKNIKFLFLFKNRKKIFFLKNKKIQKQSFRLLKLKKISKNILFLRYFLKKKRVEKARLNQQRKKNLKLKEKNQRFFLKKKNFKK